MMNVKAPRFGIGQSVVSKKTGLPVMGIVTGVLDATFYAKYIQYINVLKHYARWFQLYPTWHETWIYFVSFREPQRTCSFDEWRNVHIQSGHERYEEYELTMEKYEEVCPKQVAAMYPQDDLEAADPEQPKCTPEEEAQ
jgi:hypothetical protein